MCINLIRFFNSVVNSEHAFLTLFTCNTITSYVDKCLVYTKISLFCYFDRELEPQMRQGVKRIFYELSLQIAMVIENMRYSNSTEIRQVFNKYSYG